MIILEKLEECPDCGEPGWLLDCRRDVEEAVKAAS